MDIAKGIHKIKVVLEDRADNLNLIALKEKTQNMLVIIDNKVKKKDYRRFTRTPAWGPATKGKGVLLGHLPKLSEVAKEENKPADLGKCGEGAGL